jgi:hypothetical protein
MKTLAHIAHIALFSLVSLFGLAPVTSNAGPADSCHFHGSKPAAESKVLSRAGNSKKAGVRSNMNLSPTLMAKKVRNGR